MISKFRTLLLVLVGALIFAGCAKKGRPSGGPKDEDAPLLVTANPPYETTKFTAKEIKIEFNEYITLKELTKQLVVSPPLKNPPIITPQGTPSKYLTIQIMDTLQDNTTYIFDFGKSVQDNNEGNVLEKFQYVFSTGDYIDSLKTSGRVEDAFKSEPEKNIKLLLYRADSSYTDSLIYKQKPNYVSSTLDTTLFDFTNLAAGKFYLFALEDRNSDYFFDPKRDKIAFYDRVISIPEDSIISEPLRLFREELDYRFVRAKEEKKGKIIIGFEGGKQGIQVKPLSVVPKDFASISLFEQEKDTLNYWIHNYEKDSIVLLIKKNEVLDTAVVRLRKKELDSLTFERIGRSYLEFTDTLRFSSNNPIVKIDTAQIQLIDKDTVAISYKSYISKAKKEFGFLFEKKLGQNYRLVLRSKALTDLFGFVNDSTAYTFPTRKLEDYGDLTLNLVNPDNKNLIVQLIDARENLIIEKSTKTSGNVVFAYLRPQKLKVRIIHDQNDNGRWDTGKFLEKRKPENRLYYPKEFEIRQNWSLNETITIMSNF